MGKLKHGQASRKLKNKGTTTYCAWLSMRGRCNNKNDAAYSKYGGRGIKICKRWEVFANFFKDMGPKPANKSLDRINNDGDYKPSNCRWADRFTQARNRRGNKGTSKYKGVVKFEHRWRARITINGRLTCLGLYDDEKEAAKAYDKAAFTAWGFEAYTNFPHPNRI